MPKSLKFQCLLTNVERNLAVTKIGPVAEMN